MADFYTEHDKLVKRIEKMEETLTPAQNKVIDVLMEDEIFESFPPTFFKDNSLAELNRHLGGHDDMVVDDAVKEYMIAMQQYEEELNEMVYAFHTMDEGKSENALGGKEDSDEEQEDAADEKYPEEIAKERETFSDSEKEQFDELASYFWDMTPVDWYKNEENRTSDVPAKVYDLVTKYYEIMYKKVKSK